MSYLRISDESNRLLSSDGMVVSSEMKLYGSTFAVYSEDDSSLTFYAKNTIPAVGTTYRGKTASNIYLIDVKEEYDTNTRPWADVISKIESVTFDSSYKNVKHTSTAYWFYNMTNCTSVDMTNLNGELIETTKSMFYACTRLSELKIGNFDAPVLEDAHDMFESAHTILDFDLSTFKAPNLVNMNSMFYNCYGAEHFDLSGIDMSNVTGMNCLFYGCSAIEEIDVSSFNTASVTNMGYMFYNCKNLKTIYSNDDMFVTNAVTSGSYMFGNCNELVGGNGTAYSSNGTSDYTMAHIDKANNPGYFTAKGD